MKPEMLIAGVVALDHIITPFSEEKELLGGSLPFCAVSAALLGASPHLLGIIGEDFPPEYLELLTRLGIQLDGLEKKAGKTFRWCGQYEENMDCRTTVSRELNVLENWHVPSPSPFTECDILVLSSLTGKHHQEVLDSLSAPPRLVLSDTMDYWILNERAETDEVVSRSDIFVLNESEALLYSGKETLQDAGAFLLGLGAPFIIIKCGASGALLFYQEENGKTCCEQAAAFPLEQVLDPTGAGDAFLGGMAGYLASEPAQALSPALVRCAMDYGAVCASFVCEGFSLQSLLKAGKEGIKARFSLLRTPSLV